MSMRKLVSIPKLMAAGVLLSSAGFASAAFAQSPNLGKPIAAEDLAAWDISVGPDGAGLPPGSGTPKQGEEVFTTKCQACHNAKGAGQPNDRLVGGLGSLPGDKPAIKTVGSYWPYATTLFDFVRRAMPFDAPQSLTPDQVYSVCAYVLYLNKLVAEDAVLDAQTLPKIEMPNRAHFVNAFTPQTGAPAP